MFLNPLRRQLGVIDKVARYDYDDYHQGQEKDRAQVAEYTNNVPKSQAAMLLYDESDFRFQDVLRQYGDKLLRLLRPFITRIE